ncbi:MAG: hypothetical protein V2J55_05085 [Candidatus Competibacteraceae bacterium]|nr:hypothetical protein [Candidatus Competibacteraceae bacterium]
MSSHAQRMPIVPPDQPTGVPIPESPGIVTTFDGFNSDDNSTESGGFLFIPPDPIGAAGTNRVIAVVNTMIEARNKSGGLLWRDSLKDFFSPLGTATLGTFTFDPKVIFDHYENRFVVVTLERTEVSEGAASDESRILLAVSKSASPNTATAADWYYHSIDSKISIGAIPHWADYPGFEADEEAIYLTNNMFTFGTSRGFGGVRLWIIDKGTVGGFYNGGAAAVTVHNPYTTAGIPATTMPAQVYGASGVGSGIGTFLVSYSGISNGVDEAVQVVRIDDPLGESGGPVFIQEFVNIGNIEDFILPELPDAAQSGTNTLIEVNDRRALDAVWRNDSLWLTTTILPNTGPDNGQTTAHWIKLNTSAVPAGAITLSDQGSIGAEDIATNTYTFFPSLAVNSKGDAKFGFSASAATIFPGAYVAGRQAGDPAGTVQATETVRAGTDFYQRTFGGPRNRWGDYSGMSLDPSDDNLFWVFNEYAALRGSGMPPEDGRWGTAWASCSFETASPSLGDRIGLQRGGTWFLDLNGNGQWDGCTQDGGQDACLFNSFGAPGDLPVAGDWNGSGSDKVGTFRNGTWFLDFNGNGQWDGCLQNGGQDACLFNSFGVPGDLPAAGDWNGSGTDKVGVFRNGTWFLDFNGNGQWDGCLQNGGQDACLFNSFGAPGDLPAAGDWNGSGTDKVGVFRNGTWFLDFNGNGQWDGCLQNGGQDACLFNSFGAPGDLPAAGDWNGSGTDKVGAFRNGSWFLDFNGNGQWDGCLQNGGQDLCGTFGSSADRPVAGNWSAAELGN